MLVLRLRGPRRISARTDMVSIGLARCPKQRGPTGTSFFPLMLDRKTRQLAPIREYPSSVRLSKIGSILKTVRVGSGL